MITDIAVPNPGDFEPDGLQMVQKANQIKIVTSEDREKAGDFFNIVSGCLKRVKEVFAPAKKKADEAHAEICALEKRAAKSFEIARDALKLKIGAWEDEQERLRNEANLKAAQEARKRAEDETLRRAAAMEANGDKEAAERILEAPAPIRINPEDLIPEAQKVKGNVIRKSWGFQIIDPLAVPREYLMVDESKIRRVVQALGNETRIDGVAVFPKSIVGSRG